MVFTSFKFIIFFALVFIFYYSVMKKCQWKWLLLSSYVFYMAASPIYVIFLLASTVVTYSSARLIDDNNSNLSGYLKENKNNLTKEEKKKIKGKVERQNRAILTVSIIITLGMLIILKYSVFIVDNFILFAGVFGKEFQSPTWNIILPVGLSFYTFQTLGYCVDVFRGMYRSQNNFFKYALFVSYFPQILQGPIGNYGELEKELYSRKEFEYERICKGVIRAAWGFFKKMVIADNIAIIINPVFDSVDGYYGITVIFALVMYAIQLYADFSGFMDIALGASEMLGIKLGENFDTPYFSKSIPEFWRRWHISLGSWFRNYVFYSVLRGRKCEKIRKKYKKLGKTDKANNITTAIALSAVWLTTGIWHGANWSFIAWGVYYGVIIIFSTVFFKKSKNDNAQSDKTQSEDCTEIVNRQFRFVDLFRILRTFSIVVVGYSIFRPENLMTTGKLWINAFSGIGIDSLKILLTGKKIVFIIAMVSTLILFIRDVASTKINVEEWIRKQNVFVRWMIYIGLIIAILIFKAGETQSFSYFKF